MLEALGREVNRGIVEPSTTYHQNIFKTNIENAHIKWFIDRTPYYDQGHWHTIPKNPTAEKALYTPFMELLKHIFIYFGYTAQGRKVLDTHNVNVVHKDLNCHGSVNKSTRYKTSPNFMIMGSSSDFSTDSKNSNNLRISYVLCAAPGEIKMEKNQNEDLNTKQVTVYARYIMLPSDEEFCMLNMQNRQCFVEQHHQ